jgi:tetratricopeptide (TPR) repeat protein
MRLAITVALCWLLAASARAQSVDFADPARPGLPAGADTNDARSYASLAAAAQNPNDAYAAYLWAHRIKPTRLDYLSGVRDALEGARAERRRARRNKEAAHAEADMLRSMRDSVQRLLIVRDPFFGLPAVDGSCQPTSMKNVRTEVLVLTGLLALRRGCYYGTIAYLEEAARRDTMLEHLLHLRAMAWHMVQRPEEAAADLRRAITGVRRLQAKSFEESLYNTGLLEYVAGMMLMRIGDNVPARRAFERALTEDLSLHMAHVRLGELAMGRGDLPSALESLSLASQIRPNDALTVAGYAQALAAANLQEEARAAYVEAIRHAPYFADLRFALAELHDRSSDTTSALEAYRQYVSLAARQDSLQVQFATERIRSLQEGSR